MQGWVWYGLLYKLAQGDITKIEEVGKLNLNLAMTHLAYMEVQRNYIELKKNKNKNSFLK